MFGSNEWWQKQCVEAMQWVGTYEARALKAAMNGQMKTWCWNIWRMVMAFGAHKVAAQVLFLRTYPTETLDQDLDVEPEPHDNDPACGLDMGSHRSSGESDPLVN
jgi:hypothetical protein